MSETNGNSYSAFTLLELLLVVCIVAVVVLIARPNFSGSHTSPANACINNMRQIEGAKNEWALENGKTNGTVVTENDLTNYIKLNRYGKIPQCPAGGKYDYEKVGMPVTCSLGTNVTPAHVIP
jgi:type II secretory pathway pseudopilin PulG